MKNIYSIVCFWIVLLFCNIAQAQVKVIGYTPPAGLTATSSSSPVGAAFGAGTMTIAWTGSITATGCYGWGMQPDSVGNGTKCVTGSCGSTPAYTIGGSAWTYLSGANTNTLTLQAANFTCGFSNCAYNTNRLVLTSTGNVWRKEGGWFYLPLTGTSQVTIREMSNGTDLLSAGCSASLNTGGSTTYQLCSNTNFKYISITQPVPPTVSVNTVGTTSVNVCNGSTVTLLTSGLAPTGKGFDINNTTQAGGKYATLPAGNYFGGTDFTVETWVYPRVFNVWSRIMDFGNGSSNNNVLLALSNGTSGKPQFEVYNGTASAGSIIAPTDLPLNQWTHIACTFNNTTKVATMYLNGAAVATGTFTSGAVNITRNNCYIGRSNWYNGDWDANMIIDEFRIWNVAQSQANIVANMYKTLTSGGGLTNCYNFDGGNFNGAVGSAGTNVGGGAYSDIPSTAPYYNYTWTGTGLSSTLTAQESVTTSSLTTAVVGSTYNVKASINGCLSTVSANGTVTVRPVLTATISPTIGGPICTNGSATTFTCTPAGGSGASSGGYNYQWQYYNGCAISPTTFTNVSGGTVTGASASSSSTYTPPSSLTCQQFYQVVVTDNGTPACTGVTTTTVYQAVNPVVPAPTTSTTAPAVGMCNNTGTTVSVTGLTPGVNTFNMNNTTAAGGQYLSLPATQNYFNGTGGVFTLEAWIYPRNWNNWSRIFDFGNGAGTDNILFALSDGTNGHLVLTTLNGTTSSGNIYSNGTNLVTGNYTIPLNTWTHVAAVFDGTYGYIYANGNLVAKAISTAPKNNITRSGNFIGRSNWYSSGDWDANMLIDEVRIWNVALPQSTIAAWMYKEVTNGSHPNINNLREYLNFNNGTANSSTSTGTSNLNQNATVGGGTYAPIPGTANPYYTYTWSLPGASTTTTNPATAISTGAGNETVSVTFTNATSTEQTVTGTVVAKTTSNCSSPSSAAVTIKVEAIPGAPTLPSTTITGCGQAVIFASPGTNATTCRFYGPNSNTTLAGSGTSWGVTLSPGTYTYYVSSYNETAGCEGAKTTVSVTINPTFSLTVASDNYATYHSNDVQCYGSSNGAVKATSTSTSYPTTYAWSNGVTNTVTGSPNQNTISGLSLGTYQVTVTDNAGCVSVTNITLATQPTQVTPVITTPSIYNYNGYGVSCNGTANGGLTVSTSGGYTPSYTYAWSGPTSIPANTTGPTSLAAGTYTVTVTDGNSCTATASSVITAPAAVTFTISIGYACSGSSYTGAYITVVPSGGASGLYDYNFSGCSSGCGVWQTSNVSPLYTNGQSYTIQVRDRSYTSCTSTTQSGTITLPANGTSVGDCNFIYVSTGGDPTGTLGSKNCNVTLDAAFNIYTSNPSRNHILMQGGTYTYSSTINIPAGVIIEGGYDANWAKSTGSPTTLNINPSSYSNNGTMGYYIGMQPVGNNWALKDLTINVQSAGTTATYNNRGISIYGINTNGTTGWLVSRCTVTTGSASSGAAGVYNSTPGGGYSGGSPTLWWDSYFNNYVGSGYATTGYCSRYDASAAGGGGNAGSGPSPGSGGGGGATCQSGGCNIFGCNGSSCNGSAGGNGGTGGAGAAIAQATASLPSSGLFVPTNGSQGNAGSGGGAGGGGGSGTGGTCCSCSCTSYFGFGGPGGYGGAGGAGGAGGYGGGGNFGIYASGGSGTITDCNINPGTAGNGGAGATGRPGASGTSGGGGYYSGSGCNSTTGGNGGSGGTGGTGGTGQQGANGIRQSVVTINGASVTTNGATTTVPVDGTTTVKWERGCRLSQIDLTKTSANDWGSFINTDPIFVKNLTNTTTSYAANQNSVSIYYPASSSLGDKSISTTSTTLSNYIKLYGDRIISPVPTVSLPIIAPITAPCPNSNLSVSLDATFTPSLQTNIISWDWSYAQISPTNNSGSPTTINSSANSYGTPALVTPPIGGWVAGATYQVKMRMKENCCGWSIPVYTTFTIPTATSAPTISTPPATSNVCANTTVSYTINTVAGATSYNWTVSGGTFDANGLSTISGTALTQAIDWGGTGSGTVTVAAVNSCGQVSSSTTWNITKLSTPIVNLSGAPVTVCSGTSVNITSGVASGTSPYSYAWSPVLYISGATNGTGINTTNLTASQTYTLLVTDVNNCTGSQSATVTVTQPPTATVSYAGPYCKSVTTGQTPTLSGTGAYTGGTYGSTPAGLSLNTSTGAITPSTSTAGTYTVTYTIPASGGCSSVPVTTSVTITAIPTATISYSGTPYCSTVSTPQSVTISGTGAYTGGTYSSTPTGLTLNTGTGAITPSTSTAGTYTVTYTIPASGGCSSVPVTTSVTITATPTATISYSGAPFCNTVTTQQSVTLTGTGAYTGGSYGASPAGLSINNTTGEINPSGSAAGTYTVTYTIPASGGCSPVPVTTSVTITSPPTATISYAGSPYCTSVTTPQSVTLTGTGSYTGGTYSSTAGLSINSSTGAINPSASTVGTYTVTYTIPASGGCSSVQVTNTVTIIPGPNITNFSTSANSPVCVGGTSTVTISSTSLANGTYTVTYNLSAPNAATGQTATVTVTGGTGTFTLPALVNGGSTTVTITNVQFGGGCSSSPSGNTATVVVNAAPVITVTNASDVCVGGNVTLASSVSGGAGSPVSYIWERSANGGGSWSIVQNSSASTYLTSNALSIGNYLYKVSLTQSGANCSATSGSVSADVKADPFITLDPVDAAICPGGTATFTVNGSGGTPTLLYEWEYDNTNIVTDNDPTGSDYSGETTTTLSVNTTNSTPTGPVAYWAKVYATGNGCDATYSLFASLTVVPEPTVSNPTPATQTVPCNGGSGTAISVTANGGIGTYNYQWYSNTVNSNTGGTAIPGANSSTYTPTSVTGITYYYCVLGQSGTGCGPVASATASVTPNSVLSTAVVVDECMSFAINDKYYVLVSGVGGNPPYNFPTSFFTTSTNQGVYEVDAGTTSSFTVTDNSGCTASTTPVTAPTGRPTNIVLTSASGTLAVDCWVNNINKWVTFRDAVTNNAIMAINDNHNNLGLVTVDAYKDAGPPVIYNNGLATNCTWVQHTAMRRHFKLTSSIAPVSPVDVRLYFTDQEYQDLKADAWNNNTGYPNANYACTELDDVYNFNQLYVTKYTGVNEDNSYLNNQPSGLYRVYGDNTVPYNALIKGQYTGANTGFQNLYGGNTTHHYVQMTVTEFSEFWLHGSQVSQALPIQMIYLEANAINNTYIKVSWATATEINNDGFEVERSTDGQNWSVLGFVDGHDNSTVQNNYSFDDMNVAAGIVYYYRLRQIDNDGQFEYTDIVSARLSGESTFSVKEFVPNPTMDRTSLIVTGTKEQEINVTFYDVVGRKVLETVQGVNKGFNKFEFDLSILASGTYTAIVSSDNEVYTKKIVLTK